MKRKLAKVRVAAATLLLSALFWCIGLAISGAVVISIGCGMKFGVGYALIVFGSFCLIGSHIVRSGITRA